MDFDQKQIEHLEQHCRTLQEEHEGNQKVWEMKEQQLIAEQEALEQDKHLLVNTVNEQASLLRSLEDDMTRCKAAADNEHAVYVRRTESEYEKRIEALRDSENELREENRYTSLELAQSKERLALQGRQIEDLKQENRELSEGERWSGGELRQALEELGKVRDKCMQLEENNHEQGSRLEQAFLEREILEEKLQLVVTEHSQLSENKEVVQQLLVQVQESKDEMYAELSGVKMELEMMNFKKKGNSLFAEVDDHRKKVEIELLALRGSYRSLEALYKNSQVIARRLKSEYTLLLCQRNSLKADGAYITRLKHDLDRAGTDSSLLRITCANLERQMSNTQNLAKEFKQYLQMYGSKNLQDKEFTRFFNRQIAYWQSHCKDLLHNLEDTRKLVCALRQDNADQRTGIHQAEKRAEVCERECTLLKLKLEEISNESKHHRPVSKTPAKLPQPTVKQYATLPPPPPPGLSSHQEETKMEDTVLLAPAEPPPVTSVLQPIKKNIQKMSRDKK